jgi:hypothetical protein
MDKTNNRMREFFALAVIIMEQNQQLTKVPGKTIKR